MLQEKKRRNVVNKLIFCTCEDNKNKYKYTI